MNIKTVTTGPLLPLDPKNRVDGGVRTKGSDERDADGKRESQEQETKRNLTDAEFEEAINTLKNMAGIKANDLTVRIEAQAGVRTIFVEDLNGKIVRRLTEGQLWLATRDKDKQVGTILDKAM